MRNREKDIKDKEIEKKIIMIYKKIKKIWERWKDWIKEKRIDQYIRRYRYKDKIRKVKGVVDIQKY